jgi:hypothetical protein
MAAEKQLGKDFPQTKKKKKNLGKTKDNRRRRTQPNPIINST